MADESLLRPSDYPENRIGGQTVYILRDLELENWRRSMPERVIPAPDDPWAGPIVITATEDRGHDRWCGFIWPLDQEQQGLITEAWRAASGDDLSLLYTDDLDLPDEEDEWPVDVTVFQVFGQSSLLREAATGQTSEDLSAAWRRIEELEHQLQVVFSAHRPSSREAPAGSRWDWPIEDLIADEGWWGRWLPRLYELLGRHESSRLSAIGSTPIPTFDNRGYVDLLSHLFPVLPGNGRQVTWRSVEYPILAAVASQASASTSQRISPQTHVWEPVLRHVVVALCALEECGQVGASPQLRLKTEERLTGSWVRIRLAK